MKPQSVGVAVVTGAASGLGRATATRLASKGWTVAAVDLDSPDLRSLGNLSGTAVFACDVTDGDAVATAARRIRESLGPPRRLITAAGIAVPGRIEDVTIYDFVHSIDVNYLGTVRWVKELLPDLRQNRQGELVLFASFAGFMPTPAMAAYTATKFALVGFAETLAMELRGSAIRVRCICPPAVRTPMLDGIYRHRSASRMQKLVRPITVDAVLDAIDASLHPRRRSVIVFPDVSTKVLWRLRRAAPGLLRRAVGALLDGSASPSS